MILHVKATKCELIKGNILFMDAKLSIVKLSILPQMYKFKNRTIDILGGFLGRRWKRF